jgi:hypothetical protein
MLAPRTLIDSRIELEVDLIEAACQVQGQRTEAANLGTLSESFWKAEVKQGRGTGVEPVDTDAEDVADVAHSLDERLRQAAGPNVAAGLDHGHDVEVAGGACNETQQDQAAPADRDELIFEIAGFEGLGQRAQRIFDDRHADIITANRRYYPAKSQKA